MVSTSQETDNSRTVAVFTNGHQYTVRHRQPLLQHLRRQGWVVVGIAPDRSPALAAFKELGFPVAVVSMSRAGTNPFSELRAIWSVVQCYRRVKPTLVIHATIKPVLYGTIAASRLRVPVVNLITGLGFAYAGRSLRARVSRAVISVLYRVVFLYRKQRIILQNGDDLGELVKRSGLPRQRSIVVPGSGVDVEHFSPDPSEKQLQVQELLVILPGRMLFDKGIAEFVEAAAVLRPQFPHARFALVGPADEQNPSGIPMKMLQRWSENDEVEWWGAIPDIRDAYRQAAIVVLPSRREGMPKVVLEAAACGLPVVTTMVPGCRESVIEGVTGFAVPYGDGHALADRIARLLGSADMRREMGQNARKLAEERFAAPKIVETILKTATEIL